MVIEPIHIAIMVGVAVYLLVIALLPKGILSDSTKYTRSMLEKLSEQGARQQEQAQDDDNPSVLRDQVRKATPIHRAFFMLPGAKAAYPYMVHAGLANSIRGFFIACIFVFAVSLFLLLRLKLLGVILAVGMAYLFAWWQIKRRINKRNDAFLNYFPDALDMIVRSVKSGYPLNSAVRMVAENMQAPVSTEFKQVADEVAFGSTLIAALQRLTQRIDEPDVRFFVVVLSVQQDVGGNLSEVLGNLANIIRKRKHLRMKIKALSSEGRTTAWVLGSMPVVETLLITAVAPNHLKPLIDTHLGNMVLGVTIVTVMIGVLVVRQIVNIRI